VLNELNCTGGKVTYISLFTLKTTTAIGRSGEDKAILFLIANGYEILECNYRYGRSEIDIIVSKDGLLVFVEVKQRKNNRFGYPESFLSDAQIERIAEAAEQFIFEKNWEGNIRFDIISIEQEHGITHFEDAFH